ncbi:unnamed protein product [Leptosia nina]|uniref:Uncharacterized protein n=1 Tax=Leptosia nina TaxID=320188 RepID=A0AAV1K5Q2_9NEOP
MEKEEMQRTAMFSCRTRMKSTIASIRVSILFVVSMYTKFCEETTLHGLKHTVARNFHFIERLLWLILTSLAFTGAVYCALSQLTRYNSEPVVVYLQRDYRRWAFSFPAVTACFLERSDQEKTKGVIRRIWNITEDSDPEKFQYYQEFVDLISDVSFRENLQNFWKYQNDESLKGVDLLQLAIDVHPDVILNVSVSHQLEILWVPVMTEEGLCMTFNSVYSQYQQVGDVTARPGLMTCHYHSEFCFVRIDAMNRGVRVVEIEADGRIKNLRPEQRRCQYPDEWLADSIKFFCVKLTLNESPEKQLHVVNLRDEIQDGEVCDSDGMACIGRNVEILVNLPKNLAKCPCAPQCAELNYYSHTKKIVVR